MSIMYERLVQMRFERPVMYVRNAAPTMVSTNLPFLKMRSEGNKRTPYSVGITGLLSTSILPTTALPSYSLARSSIIGAI